MTFWSFQWRWVEILLLQDPTESLWVIAVSSLQAMCIYSHHKFTEFNPWWCLSIAWPQRCLFRDISFRFESHFTVGCSSRNARLTRDCLIWLYPTSSVFYKIIDKFVGIEVLVNVTHFDEPYRNFNPFNWKSITCKKLI